MTDTTFVSKTTIITTSWLQDTNNTVYRALGSGGVAPTTPAGVRSNLGFTASSGSSLVGFVQAGVGAVDRTIQDKARETVSGKDFGVTGSGTETAKIQAAINATDNLVLDQTALTSGALTGTSKMISWPAGKYTNSAALDDPIAASNLPIAPALTHAGGKHAYSVRFGNATPNGIYNAIFPGVAHFDALNGVTQITSGSTIEHATGIAGYVQNNDVSPANAVGVFGCGIATIDGAAVWGINTLLQDAATRTAGTGTGRKIINEFDFNVMNPATEVIGLSVGGNSLAQPTLAQAFIANSLGTGIKWTNGFVTGDGCVDSTVGAAVRIGAEAASGTSVNSQRQMFGWRDGAGSARVTLMQMTGGGFFSLSSTGAWNGLSISQGNLYLSAGFSLIIGGNGVVGNRKTGWTAATGTATRTTFDTGTVSLSVLAEHVKALIDDLISHGLIGA